MPATFHNSELQYAKDIKIVAYNKQHFVKLYKPILWSIKSSFSFKITIAGDNPVEDPLDKPVVGDVSVSAVVSVEDEVCFDTTLISFVVFSGRHLILASISSEKY